VVVADVLLLRVQVSAAPFRISEETAHDIALRGLMCPNHVTPGQLAELSRQENTMRASFHSHRTCLVGRSAAVMPFSSAADPVRTLAALALRLSRHFG